MRPHDHIPDKRNVYVSLPFLFHPPLPMGEGWGEGGEVKYNRIYVLNLLVRVFSSEDTLHHVTLDPSAGSG
jgi:hypothetical protein